MRRAKAAGLCALDCGDKVLSRLLAHPLQRDELLFGESVKVGRVLDQTLRKKLGHDRRPQVLDVHRAPPPEVFDRPLDLGWA